MTSAGLSSSGASSLSIGSVLDALRTDFPEITISKIRFLESEGLIHPARTPAGYRQFSHSDVARLRFVLAAQRDHYLPLKVIRAKLEEFDADSGIGAPSIDPRGADAAPGSSVASTSLSSLSSSSSSPVLSSAPPVAPYTTAGPSAGPAVGPVRSRLSSVGQRGPGGGGPGGGGPGGGGPGGGGPGGPGGPGSASEVTPGGTVDRAALLAEDGVDTVLLEGLEHHGLLRPDSAGRFPAEAPALVRTAAALARLGVEPRLLRGARASADREVGLLTQLVTPVARGRAPEAARRAEDLSGELATLSGHLHALLVGAGLRHELRT